MAYSLTIYREIQDAEGDWREIPIEVSPDCGSWKIDAIDGRTVTASDPLVQQLYACPAMADAVRDAILEDRERHG